MLKLTVVTSLAMEQSFDSNANVRSMTLRQDTCAGHNQRPQLCMLHVVLLHCASCHRLVPRRNHGRLFSLAKHGRLPLPLAYERRRTCCTNRCWPKTSFSCQSVLSPRFCCCGADEVDIAVLATIFCTTTSPWHAACWHMGYVFYHQAETLLEHHVISVCT
jgi:hypothetical protein